MISSFWNGKWRCVHPCGFIISLFVPSSVNRTLHLLKQLIQLDSCITTPSFSAAIKLLTNILRSLAVNPLSYTSKLSDSINQLIKIRPLVHFIEHPYTVSIGWMAPVTFGGKYMRNTPPSFSKISLVHHRHEYLGCCMLEVLLLKDPIFSKYDY